MIVAIFEFSLSIADMELLKPSVVSAFWNIPFSLDKMSDVVAVLFAISVFILSTDFEAPDKSMFEVAFLNIPGSLDNDDSDFLTDFSTFCVNVSISFWTCLAAFTSPAFVNACFNLSKDFIVSSAFFVNALLSNVTLAIFSST